MDLKSNWFQYFSIISSNTFSNEHVWNLPHISVIIWTFSKIFLLKISLISTYKMPPRLLSNLLKVLSNLSPNIRKIGNSPYWPPGHDTLFPRPEVTSSSANLHTSKERRKAKMAAFVWRIGNFSNIPTLVSQCSYHISSQTRWHPLAPNKTFLQ